MRFAESNLICCNIKQSQSLYKPGVIQAMQPFPTSIFFLSVVALFQSSLPKLRHHGEESSQSTMKGSTVTIWTRINCPNVLACRSFRLVLGYKPVATKQSCSSCRSVREQVKRKVQIPHRHDHADTHARKTTWPEVIHT